MYDDNTLLFQKDYYKNFVSFSSRNAFDALKFIENP